MLANRGQLLRLTMDGDPREVLLPGRAEQVAEADRVIEVSVGQEDIEGRRLQMPSHAKKTRPRIQHNPRLRQHQASRLPTLAGMIAGGAEEEEFHVFYSPSSGGGAKPRRTVCSVIVRGITNCSR